MEGVMEYDELKRIRTLVTGTKRSPDGRFLKKKKKKKRRLKKTTKTSNVIHHTTHAP